MAGNLNPFPDVPGRVFLDTSVVNFILDFGEQIHEALDPPEGLTGYQLEDINALYNVFHTGKRASWQLAVSPATYREVIGTSDLNRRKWLENWFFEIWSYWQEILSEDGDLPTLKDAEEARVDLLSSGVLDVLPQMSDRALLCDAVVYRCDAFCTRDFATIIKHRDKLASLGVPILRPVEWWRRVEPYASIWA